MPNSGIIRENKWKNEIQYIMSRNRKIKNV